MTVTCPILLIVQQTSLEHIFKNLVHSLRLTIGLWLISWTMDQMCPQGSMQLLPEMSDKLGSSVRNDHLGHTMETHDVNNI
jgi:hypothetical protein